MTTPQITDPAVLTRAWLTSVGSVAALVAGRVGVSTDADAKMPAVLIASATGGPTYTAAGDSGKRVWTVTLWCLAGRLNDGASDLPDTATAWAVANAIVGACADLVGNPFEYTPARIVDAEPLSVTAATEPTTGWARTTCTVRLTVHE